MDTDILLAINGFSGQNPNFDRLVVYLQHTYIAKGLVPVLVLVGIFFSRNVEKNDRRVEVIATLAVVFISILAARLMQLGLPHVERPFATSGLPLNNASMPSDAIGGNSSFPSDHALMFVTLAICVLQYERLAGVLLLLHALIIVSLPRIFLGLHWPSDILAGALLGVMFSIVLQRPISRLLYNARILEQRKRHPALFNVILFATMIETANMYIGLRNLVSLVSEFI